jgi:hypothetical protein
MSNLTKPASLPHDGNPSTRSISYTPASDTDGENVFAGSVLVQDGSAAASNVIAAGRRFLGFAGKTRSANAVTAENLEAVNGRFKITGPTIAATDVSKRLFISVSGGSNNPADLLPESAADVGDIPVGTIDFMESTTSFWVDTTRKAAEALLA